MEAFLLRWGYLAIVVGTFFEGESVLLLAGALAHRGLLSLPFVCVAALIGSVSGDQLWFHLGHRYGRRFIDTRPHWAKRAESARKWIARYGDWFVLGFRFVYGLRMASPIVLGTSGYSARKFTVLNATGGALWSVTFGLLGYALAASLQKVLHRAGRLEELALLALVLAACAALAWRRRQRLSAATR